jgi:hypothetical protein
MKKGFFSSILAVLILFWAIGTTSYSQDKTEKKTTKTMVTSKDSTATKSKMPHKHHMKSGKMKGKKKTDSTQKEKSN